MFYRLPQRLAQALPRRLDYRRLGEMGPDLEIIFSFALLALTPAFEEAGEKSR